jgi:uncharacterized protein DUF3261
LFLNADLLMMTPVDRTAARLGRVVASVLWLSRAAAVTGLGMSLGSCAALTNRPADPGRLLIPPHAARRTVSVMQTVRVERAGAPPFAVLALVELDEHWLRVAALGPFGNRILLLEWDGTTYHEEREPQIPADLPLELVLRDIQLALFPASAIRQALPSPSWTVSETRGRRVLLLDQKPVISIDYSGEDHFRCSVSYHHIALGYTVEIQPAEGE